MLGFPRTTEYNKRVPKQKFYENMDISPALKRAFAEQIKLIYWRNKLAPSTMNVAEGKSVTEIEVLELRLNQQGIDEAVLNLIDTTLSYHIVFVLEYEGWYQVWISYKERSPGGARFRVQRYYHTGWAEPGELSYSIDGLDMDAAYAGLVRQIAGEQLTAAPGDGLKESVERAEKRRQLEKNIAALEKKIYREKQFNRQVEMNAELKKLRKELEGLNNVDAK